MADDSTPVSPDTDNIEDFRKLWNGSAQEAQPEPEATGEDDVEDEVTLDEDVDTDLTDDDSVAEDDSEPEEKPKKKKSIDERFKELTAKEKAAERRAAELEAKLAEVLAQVDQKKVENEAPVRTSEAPQPDDVNEDGSLKYPLGEFDPTFRADEAKFLFTQMKAEMKAEAEAEAAQAQEVQARDALLASWSEKTAAAAEALPDYAEKTESLAVVVQGIEPGYGDYLASTIMQMEKGPEVLYYLADHPEEAAAIVASGARAATLALGRLEGQLAGKKATPRKVSDAPNPPPTRARGAGGKFDVADDTDDYVAFRNKWNNQK